MLKIDHLNSILLSAIMAHVLAVPSLFQIRQSSTVTGTHIGYTDLEDVLHSFSERFTRVIWKSQSLVVCVFSFSSP